MKKSSVNIIKASEYHEALAQIEKYLEKGFTNLNKSATADLKKLSLAVEAYEQAKYPMPLKTDIISILEEYMFENRLNKNQLAKLLQVPNSTLSEILNGKRKINLALVKKLHQQLKIDGNFLLETV